MAFLTDTILYGGYV